MKRIHRLRPSPFWDVAQCRLVVGYRHFGTTNDKQRTLCNIPEDRRPQQHRSGRVSCRKWMSYFHEGVSTEWVSVEWYERTVTYAELRDWGGCGRDLFKVLHRHSPVIWVKIAVFSSSVRTGLHSNGSLGRTVSVEATKARKTNESEG